MSMIAGFIVTLTIFIYAMNPDNASLYFHMHSFVLIFGGTLSILVFSTPMDSLRQLKNEFLNVFKNQIHFAHNKNELVKLSKNRNQSITTKNELIIYAQDLWSQGINQELFVVLLSQKKQEIEQRSINAIQSLKNLAKYPPALGMTGTVIGMVSLFQSLDGNKQAIGPSLALAMTATFMGLVLANGLVMPLADRLQLKYTQDKSHITNIYQILLLIGQNEPQNLVEDEVEKRAA